MARAYKYPITEHMSREWLYQKYVVEDLGTPAIAKLAGRDNKTIWYWLQKHGIPTRPIGARSRFARATEFQPGKVPEQKLSVGSQTIRIDKNGRERNWIKIAEPNQWILLAVFVWESCYGPIPKGHILHHKDGDSLHDSPENLEPVTRSQHIGLHRSELLAARQKTV